MSYTGELVFKASLRLIGKTDTKKQTNKQTNKQHKAVAAQIEDRPVLGDSDAFTWCFFLNSWMLEHVAKSCTLDSK